ncbi:MAG: hypothetical protein ABI120_13195, partial [Gemmatimonadaceae bacterium]
MSKSISTPSHLPVHPAAHASPVSFRRNALSAHRRTRAVIAGALIGPLAAMAGCTKPNDGKASTPAPTVVASGVVAPIG